jgi:hypothetical protein
MTTRKISPVLKNSHVAQQVEQAGAGEEGRPAAHRHARPHHPAETRREILTKKLHLSPMYFIDFYLPFSLLTSMK